MKENPTIALIVAAGSSSRYGGELPKPYINLMGKPVLAHVLKAFCCHPRIDGVRVVISRAHHPLYKQAAKDFKLFTPVVGGERRQDSVRIGLEAVARVNPSKVLIHDAARPLVDKDLISRVIDELDDAPAVLPYLPVTDSIYQTGGGLTPLDRSQLVAAQTPQGFHFDAILQAHQQFMDKDVTDDIALAKLAGLDITLIEGGERNIKLTTQEQLAMMEAMIEQIPSSRHRPGSIDRLGAGRKDDSISFASIRIGQGYDVHAFEEHADGAAEEISLCGIRIPHNKALKGHSDADVGLHALTDALLGSIAAGDIGQHFPPSDPKWQGVNSRVFLEHAWRLLKQQKAEIAHIDVTIIGEAPKVSPHREAMRQQIAGILQLDVRRVSVKATTTEKLGYLGRGEGLAAQAIATVSIAL